MRQWPFATGRSTTKAERAAHCDRGSRTGNTGSGPRGCVAVAPGLPRRARAGAGSVWSAGNGPKRLGGADRCGGGGSGGGRCWGASACGGGRLSGKSGGGDGPRSGWGGGVGGIGGCRRRSQSDGRWQSGPRVAPEHSPAGRRWLVVHSVVVLLSSLKESTRCGGSAVILCRQNVSLPLDPFEPLQNIRGHSLRVVEVENCTMEDFASH